MTVNQRLKEFIHQKNIPLVEFAKTIGTSKQNVSNWINAGQAISVRMIQLILTAHPDLNARWLLIGEGKMMLDDSNRSAVQEEIPAYTKDLMDRYDEKVEEIVTLKSEISNLQNLLASENNSRQDEP